MSAAAACELPARLEAREPPEARGRARDEVRMLVARPDGRLDHARFRDLPDFLEPGDLLVINTSRTVPAALRVEGAGGQELELHLSTPLPNGGEDRWAIELRSAQRPFRRARAGEVLALPGGARAELLAPYLSSMRLWAARLSLPEPLLNYLTRHGHPIRYGYVSGDRPISDYQTVYGQEPGSAEMPSAGRPFTPELITALVARGIAVAPVVLHTGVSSLERGERPYPERYRVPVPTARLVTATRGWGGRVVAVGTTAVRALETVARPDGSVDPGEGWTGLVVTPERGLRAVDGLLTGWHEPGSSHVNMLEALAEPRLLAGSTAPPSKAATSGTSSGTCTSYCPDPGPSRLHASAGFESSSGETRWTRPSARASHDSPRRTGSGLPRRCAGDLSWGADYTSRHVPCTI